jgi:hypothetical protein
MNESPPNSPVALRLMLTGQTDHGKSTWAGYLLWKYGNLTGAERLPPSAYSRQLDELVGGLIMDGKSNTYYSQAAPFVYTKKSFLYGLYTETQSTLTRTRTANSPLKEGFCSFCPRVFDSLFYTKKIFSLWSLYRNTINF